MKVVYMSGGLGCQLYQYIFSRFLAIRSNNDVYLDTSLLEIQDKYNGFELERAFPNIKFTLLKNRFDENIWENLKANMGGYFITDVLGKNDKYFQVLVEGTSVPADYFYEAEEDAKRYVHYFHPNSFHQEHGVIHQTTSVPQYNNSYFVGMFESDKYFHSYFDEFADELQFQPIAEDDHKNQFYLEDIRSCYSIGVHIRRGDFLDEDIQLALPSYYYHDVISDLRPTLNLDDDPVFFVFSDDIPWCKEHEEDLGFLPDDELIFIEGNTVNTLHYLDLQLMCECEVMIGSRSKFCEAVTYLSDNLIQYIPAPSRKEKYDYEDLLS